MKKYQLMTIVCGMCLGGQLYASNNLASGTIEPSIISTQEEHAIVDFSTIYSQEVPRDIMIVTLFTQKEAKTLAEISGSVTKELNQAVDIAKKQGIDNLVTQRNSYIRYDKNGRATGWIDRAELTLSGKNFEALASVIAQLEGKMAVQEMSFDISQQQKKALEQRMTKEALQEFKQKALLISQELGAKGYQVVRLNVSNENVDNSSRPVVYSKMASFAAASDAAIEVEGGKSRIQVAIFSSIRLLP